MKCPVCGKEMVTENFGVNVDVCENGCKGIWFDQGELMMLDEKNEGLGAALEAALRYPRNNDGQRGPIKCPKCGIPMHTHKYERDKEVNVDECYAEVQAYADKIINSVPEYAQAMKDLDAQKKRLESIQKLTKFLTVDYWRKKF